MKIARRVALMLGLCTFATASNAQERFPGEICFDIGSIAQMAAMDIRVYMDSMNNNFQQASKKRASGDVDGAEVELKYSDINRDRMYGALSAFSGAMALADAFSCDVAAIHAKSQCGYIQQGGAC